MRRCTAAADVDGDGVMMMTVMMMIGMMMIMMSLDYLGVGSRRCTAARFGHRWTLPGRQGHLHDDGDDDHGNGEDDHVHNDRNDDHDDHANDDDERPFVP